MFKKTYIEQVVVNEELEEENDGDRVFNRRRLNFSNISFDDDLPSKFKLETMKSGNIGNSRGSVPVNIAINMDLVVEVKEEENSILKFENKKSSPRVKYLTDIKMEYAMNSPNFIGANSFKRPSITVDKDEIIAEDNNENMVEIEIKQKRSELHKNMFENVIDKEENPYIVQFNTNTSVIFETINEENFEEDEKEVLPRKKSKRSIICII